MNLEALAHQATTALLAQQHVVVTHPKGWERDGFPLPVKRMQPKADGSVTQSYRPIVIFEYVHEKLSRPSEPKAAEEVSEDVDLFGGADANLFG